MCPRVCVCIYICGGVGGGRGGGGCHRVWEGRMRGENEGYVI